MVAFSIFAIAPVESEGPPKFYLLVVPIRMHGDQELGVENQKLW